MEQKFTILFDLDGTLVDTAPDLIRAHNHVMKKFGYPTKSINELKNAVGKGAKAIMAKGNGKWEWFDEKIKNEMTDEFLLFIKKIFYMRVLLLMALKNF
jgi:phosphoglycolate phosphatase